MSCLVNMTSANEAAQGIGKQLDGLLCQLREALAKVSMNHPLLFANTKPFLLFGPVFHFNR